MPPPAEEHPIEPAIERGDLAAVQAIVAADPTVLASRDDFNSTPLMTAIDAEDLPIIEFLLASGADPNAKADDGYTCLLTAIESETKRSIEIVRTLLDAGADINGEGISGWTPLHMAAARDYVEVARLLIERGADVDRRSSIDGGDTPLLEAAALGRAAVVRLLLEHGADTEVRNDMTGYTALEAAKHAAAGPDQSVYRMLKENPPVISPSDILEEIAEQTPGDADGHSEVLASLRETLASYDAAESYAESARKVQQEGDFVETIRLLAGHATR